MKGGGMNKMMRGLGGMMPGGAGGMPPGGALPPGSRR
jgi:signal recognition particle subunit SRP54